MIFKFNLILNDFTLDSKVYFSNLKKINKSSFQSVYIY